MYVTPEYYSTVYNGNTIPFDVLDKHLRDACRHIDTLTYNRIRSIGFENLTDFQKEVVQTVICMQADFEYENADEIGTVLSSYSINGVSAQFGSSWNVVVEYGVAMKRETYAYLCQSGLCCGLARQV